MRGNDRRGGNRGNNVLNIFIFSNIFKKMNTINNNNSNNII